MERADQHRGLSVILIGAFLLVIAPGWGDAGAVWAQAKLRERIKPVKIVQIYGRDTLEVGELETYRARVNQAWEATYSWQVSDGTKLGGNPIVYRFKKPGHYTLIATAVNPKGRDADTLAVFVHEKEPPPMASRSKPDNEAKRKSESRASASKESEAETSAVPVGLKGETTPGNHYTWVVATYFERPPAEALANSYRAVGFKSSVIIDSGGKGSTVFRVTLGQFESENKAMQAKAEVMRNGVKNPLLQRTGGS